MAAPPVSRRNSLRHLCSTLKSRKLGNVSRYFVSRLVDAVVQDALLARQQLDALLIV